MKMLLVFDVNDEQQEKIQKHLVGFTSAIGQAQKWVDSTDEAIDLINEVVNTVGQ